MSQLLIVDIQKTYQDHLSEALLLDILGFAKEFTQVHYLYDDIDGQSFENEVPDIWLEDDSFYSSLIVMRKNYAFFRDLMDLGLDSEDEELILLAKFMRSHNISDVREIDINLEIKKDFLKKFKNSPLLEISFDDYSFYLPYDLIEELESKIKNGVVLVGGGRNECLKEVALLLKVLDIDFVIREDLTY